MLLHFLLFSSVYATLNTPILAQQSNTSTLTFNVSSGGNDNYFYRDNITSLQLVLTSANNTSSDVQRMVVALPAGNSGALVYFLPLSDSISTGNSTGDTTGNSTGSGNVTSTGNSTFGISLVNGTLQSTTDEFNNTGAQAELAFTGNATLGVTIIGAVRAMRGIEFIPIRIFETH